MTDKVRLSLLKQTGGAWDQVRGGVHDDLESIEISFNRLVQLVALLTDIPEESSVTITDVLPAVLLLSRSGSTQHTPPVPAVDPIPTSFLLGGM